MKNKSNFVVVSVISIMLISSISFFSFKYYSETKNNGEVLGTNDYQDISVNIKIDYFENKGDYLNVKYTYTYHNPNDVKVLDFTSINNLKQNFYPYNFEVTSLESSNLELNSNFDGQNSIVLVDNEILNAKTEAKISVSLKLYNNNNLGPFKNYVSANGVFETDDLDPIPANGRSGNADSSIETIDSSLYEEEQDLTPRDFKLFLINRDNNTVIMEIKNGTVIDFDEIMKTIDTGLGLIIEVGPENKGSTKFIVENGPIKDVVWKNLNFPVEYNFQWIDWMLEEKGNFTVKISAYTKKNAEGKLINHEIINFFVPEKNKPPVTTSASGNVEFILEAPNTDEPTETYPPSYINDTSSKESEVENPSLEPVWANNSEVTNLTNGNSNQQNQNILENPSNTIFELENNTSQNNSPSTNNELSAESSIYGNSKDYKEFAAQVNGSFTNTFLQTFLNSARNGFLIYKNASNIQNLESRLALNSAITASGNVTLPETGFGLHNTVFFGILACIISLKLAFFDKLADILKRWILKNSIKD